MDDWGELKHECCEFSSCLSGCSVACLNQSFLNVSERPKEALPKVENKWQGEDEEEDVKVSFINLKLSSSHPLIF